MILGLIPARGGSKGIPRKNIKPLGGKPLIQWTVEAARASGVIDRLVVSTDEPEIHRVVESLGVETLVRPEKLATDDAPMISVVRHALKALPPCEVVVLLQPTTPFRNPEMIGRAVKALRKCECAVSVAPVPKRYSPEVVFDLCDDTLSGVMECRFGLGNLPGTRQEVQTRYIRDGGVYAFHAKNVLEKGSIYGDGYNVCGLVAGDGESINIDEESDWQEAERRLLVTA